MTTTAAPTTAPTPVRELLTNQWLLLFLGAWAAATGYILTTDRSMLPLSDQAPIGYFTGIAGGVAGLAILFVLARNVAPLDHNPAGPYGARPIARGHGGVRRSRAAAHRRGDDTVVDPSTKQLTGGDAPPGGTTVSIPLVVGRDRRVDLKGALGGERRSSGRRATAPVRAGDRRW